MNNDLIRFGGRKLRGKPPEFVAEGQVRFDYRRGFGVDAWHVDRVTDFSREQSGADRLGDFDAYVFLRLSGACAEVRGEDDVSRSRSGNWREAHYLENIESGRSDMSIRQRPTKCRFINQPAASTIDDPHAFLQSARRRASRM